MAKVVIILNDGTDEIYNIHGLVVHNKSQFYFDLMSIFLTGDIDEILNDVRESQGLSNPNLDDVLKHLLDSKYYQVITTSDPTGYLQQVNDQRVNTNRMMKYFKEEDFVPWNQAEKMLFNDPYVNCLTCNEVMVSHDRYDLDGITHWTFNCPKCHKEVEIQQTTAY